MDHRDGDQGWAPFHGPGVGGGVGIPPAAQIRGLGPGSPRTVADFTKTLLVHVAEMIQMKLKLSPTTMMRIMMGCNDLVVNFFNAPQSSVIEPLVG